MEIPVRPIVLLADSQLLFWKPEEGESFARRLRGMIRAERPRAAYIGASNGDEPAFYELFRGAMEAAGIFETRMIPSEPSETDWDFFDASDLVLLAGGDVAQGWRTFKKNGLKQKIIERYYAGAVLVGVSAGAVQLGLYGFRTEDGQEDEGGGELKLFETFKLVPALVDAHAEPEWERLGACLAKAHEPTHGLGIPTGGGALLHPDLTLEPIRRPVTEVRRDEDGEIHHHLIFPPSADELAAAQAEEEAARAAAFAAEESSAEHGAEHGVVSEILVPSPEDGSATREAPRVVDVEAVAVGTDAVDADENSEPS